MSCRVGFLVEPGDVSPPVNGLSVDRSFYSLDAQAGRPALLLLAADLAPGRLEAWLKALARWRDALIDADCDIKLLVDLSSAHAKAFAAENAVVFCEGDALRRFGGEPPFLALVDRAARLVALREGEPTEAVAAMLAALATLPRETPHDDTAPAPVLLIPDVLSSDACRTLVDRFEASPHTRGGMAGRDAEGRGYHKIDESKKKRSDYVLGPNDPLLATALNGIIRRCVPEIRKAFNVTIAHTDRLLLARYDSGGFFMRHRDNSAPGTEFRQFALSVNLNNDYDGGHVTFPEYNARRYRPPAGGAVVFSGSLLHEATPVTRGSRYVLLTFLHDAAAQARWVASAKV